MNPLLSHPDRPLARHLAEVHQAANLILDRHAAEPLSAVGLDARAVLRELAAWHDVAKATRFFQDYIGDTTGYANKVRSGRARLEQKTHAPLGSLLAMRHFCANGAGDSNARLLALLIALAVRGHHSRTPTLDSLKDTFDNADLLEEQFLQLSSEVETCHAALMGKIGPLLSAGIKDVLAGAEDGLFDAKQEFFTQSSPLPDRVRFRLAFQFCFSCLLEADKALLIHETVETYLGARGKVLSATVVEEHPLRDDSHVEINIRRRAAFDEVVREAETCVLSDRRPRRFTLATGLGKTRCAAGWAFHLRRRIEDATGNRPKIFVVLPFLSVIEQTSAVYRELLELPAGHTNDSTLQQSHSLSMRDRQDIENPDEAEFALDTWRSDIVLTTFDQFLLALIDDRTKHQQRFHNLCDAIVILDEVQGLPCHLWHPVGMLMKELADVGRTRFLVMTATQPVLLPDESAVTVVNEPGRYARGRYRMEFDVSERPISAWREQTRTEIGARSNRSIDKWLIILNTRRSAQDTYRFLKESPPRTREELFLLSSDIVPRDRLDRIEQIKRSDRCIAVTTQCVEAGVDIDMHRVIRDFAPLDSLIQAAGRCNRNDNTSRATVRVVRLLDEDEDGNGRSAFCNYIYDRTLLSHTQDAIAPFLDAGLNEEQVTEVVERYFSEIVEKSVKALGKDTTDKWSRFEHGDLNISRLLRGVQDQISFVVLKRDPTGTLRDRMEAASNIQDRWARRRAMHCLAPEIAKLTVSVWKTAKVDLDEVAEPFPANAEEPWFWLLQDEYYDEEIGLCLTKSLSTRIL